MTFIKSVAIGMHSEVPLAGLVLDNSPINDSVRDLQLVKAADYERVSEVGRSSLIQRVAFLVYSKHFLAFVKCILILVDELRIYFVSVRFISLVYLLSDALFEFL